MIIKRLFHILMLLFVFCLVGCNRTKNAESIKQYTYVTRWGNHTTDAIPFDSLFMSDPFILADEVTQMYYLTGSGGQLWKSKDLKIWAGPYDYIEIDTTSWMGNSPRIWAPELHKYKDRYYCFVTFTNSKIIVDTVPNRYNVQRRASHILVADKAEGPYRPVSDQDYLPEKWSTIDGGFWEEDGIPYMVFCHEWMQTIDGMIDYIELSSDLSESVGIPITLFNASEASWPREMNSIGELTFGMALGGYVADGPFLFRTGTGHLGMLWSSWGSTRYAQGVAYSESGKLEGPWIQSDKPLISDNSGHASLFRTFNGELLMIVHHQSLDIENPEPRKPVLFEVDISGDEIKIIGKYNP